MDFVDFHDGSYDPRVVGFLDRLCRQDALAIIHYGSSLRPEDFIPGVSDFDLVVISHEPLVDVENDLRCKYFYLSPQTFVSELATGTMFWISALQSGRVLFDPQGFLRNLLALVDSGLGLETTMVTLRNCAQITVRRLSAAINLYLSGRRDPAAIRQLHEAVYASAKGLGAYHAISATGKDPHGFEGIARAVQGQPVEAVMRRSRARLLAGKGSPAVGPVPVLIEEDDLGAGILDVERAYCDGLALLPGRRSTNELIRQYTATHGPITRTAAVHIDATRNSHLVAAWAGDRFCVFGVADLRLCAGGLFVHDAPDPSVMEAVMRPLVPFRRGSEHRA